MGYRLVPGQDIHESVRHAAEEQIDRSISRFSKKSKEDNAVHETRKSLKRLRALLHLVRPGMRKSDFQRDATKLKQIAKSLSGVRDIQAMLETVAKLEAYDDTVGHGPVARALRSHLEAKRDEAEKNLNGSGSARTRKLLKEARQAFGEIDLKPNDFFVLARTIKRDYRKAKLAFRIAYETGKDEAFHNWRKYVQRHWRQLLLLLPSWPKALRPYTILARDLSDALGEDHDLFVLSNFIASAEVEFGSQSERQAYLALCQWRQDELRLLARDMGARLFAEKPSSLAARLTAYWETAPYLEEPEPNEDKDDASNVITLKR